MKNEMKKSEVKPLKEKLMDAVNKVLLDNKAELTNKIDKVVRKSVKKIVKKTEHKISETLKKK
jgi:hypothetical protein